MRKVTLLIIFLMFSDKILGQSLSSEVSCMDKLWSLNISMNLPLTKF